MDGNEMAIMNDENGLTMELTGKRMVYCSLKGETPAEKAVMFKSMNNPAMRLKDEINKIVLAKDLYCETVELLDQETGELVSAPRIVIIDDKGVGHVAVSKGVFNAVKKLIQVFGQPTWITPIPLEIKQISKGVYNILTFDVKA